MSGIMVVVIVAVVLAVGCVLAAQTIGVSNLPNREVQARAWYLLAVIVLICGAVLAGRIQQQQVGSQGSVTIENPLLEK